MFTGAELLLISGGLNAGSTVLGLGSAYSADKINEIVADTEAKIVAENTKVQAANIRREGDAVMGAARTALAASGVDVAGGGTVDVIERRITQDTERDAYATLFSGEREANALRDQADAYGKRAQDSLRAGILNIGSTVFDTAAGVSKWKRSQTQ